jgi:hypothetical protein
MCLVASGGAVGNDSNPKPESKDAISLNSFSIFIFLIKFPLHLGQGAALFL